MAPAVISASPALRDAVIQCVNQRSASPAVQQAAIQVYRLAPVPDKASDILCENSWKSSCQTVNWSLTEEWFI